MNDTSNDTGKSRWLTLNSERTAMLTKFEQLAKLTVPHVCTPESYNEKTDILTYDWQSFGATSVNHLQNKLMLALFAPSRPFFRLELDAELKQLIELQLESAQQQKSSLEEQLSQAEKMAVKKLDALNLRAKLSDIIINLIILGNCLFELNKDKSRVYNIRKWACKRDVYGKLYELMIKEEVLYAHLTEDIRKEPSIIELNKIDTDKIEMVKWVKRNSKGDYIETQWVEDVKLPSKYDGKYTEETLPYRVLTWTLPDGSDYGIGHVEKVMGSLQQLSMLEKARVQGAVLASEFRWLVNPNGITNVEDLEESENGSVVSGNPEDVNIVSSGTTSALPHLENQIGAIKQELGKFFLVSQIRDAERVTREEIRLQAQELESSLGGAYTNIANELQAPLAKFLLANIDNPVKLDKKGMRIVVITGLDALSRNGDVDSMNALITNMAQISQLPPSMMQIVNMKNLFNFFAAGYGVSTKDLLLSDEQIAANQQMQLQAQMNGAEGPAPGVEPTPAGPPA